MRGPPIQSFFFVLKLRAEKLAACAFARRGLKKEEPIDIIQLEEKLTALRAAGTSDEKMRKVMHEVVPTYKAPEEVNAKVQAGSESSDNSKLS